MAATVSTLATDITAPVNFVLMRGLLSAARKKLPFFNGTLPGSLEMNQGSASVKWRRIENLTASTTALAELSGTAAAFLGRNTVVPTITDVTVALAKYGNAILLTEELDLFNVNSRSIQLMDTMGANAGESLNTLMGGLTTSVYQGATTIRRANNVATDLTVITAIALADVKSAVNTLNRNSARVFESMATGSVNIGTSTVRSSYYGICHPDVEEDIRSLTGFIGVEQYAGYTETMPFEFGAVNGVRWAASEVTYISVAGATSVAAGFRPTGAQPNDLYSSFIYGQEAVGTVGLGENHAEEVYQMYDPSRPPAVELIYHAPGTSGVYDLYNEVGSISWKSWFAGKILNQNWIVCVRTLATRL